MSERSKEKATAATVAGTPLTTQKDKNISQPAGEAVAEPSREPQRFMVNGPTARLMELADLSIKLQDERDALLLRVESLEREIAEKDMAWTRALGFGGETPVTPEYAQESIAAHNREMSKRAEAAEARVALLEEKLAQFDAYGMPNVNASLLRIEKAEKEARALKEALRQAIDAFEHKDRHCDVDQCRCQVYAERREARRIGEALLSAGEHEE